MKYKKVLRFVGHAISEDNMIVTNYSSGEIDSKFGTMAFGKNTCNISEYKQNMVMLQC